MRIIIPDMIYGSAAPADIPESAPPADFNISRRSS
jgi:hypothetical protein